MKTCVFCLWIFITDLLVSMPICELSIAVMKYVQKSLSEKTVIKSQLVREVLAEFIGTTFFLGMGFGCSFTSRLSRGTAGNVMTENLGWALALIFGITTAGGVSGGHLNSSITLTFGIIGRLPWYKVPLYIMAQIFGGFCASSIAYGVYYDAFQAYDGGIRSVNGVNATAGFFATYPQDFLSNVNAFVNEVFATAILLFCVIIINDKKNMGVPFFLMPLFSGLAFLMILCSLCYNNGCAMNPARDLGPRFFTLIGGWGVQVFSFRNYNWFWIPILGPLCGGPLGAMMYNLFIGRHLPNDQQYSVDSSNMQIRASTDVEDELDQNYLHKASRISSQILVRLK